MNGNTAIIGIIGSLGGVILGYLLSLHGIKVQFRRSAGAKLRAAFAPEIAKYFLVKESDFDRHEKKMETIEMFKTALPNHAAAIEEYRCFISPKRQGAYQQAWENYYWNYGSVFFDDYLHEEGRQLFKKRINAIFEFTNI